MRIQKRSFVRQLSWLALAILLVVPRGGAAPPPDQLQLTPPIKSFITAKEQQARRLAEEFHEEVSPDFWRYFAAARQGDAVTAAKIFDTLKRRNSQYEGATEDVQVTTVAFQPLIEVECLLGCWREAGSKYTELFGQEIIKAIPRGAIYFGGTDPGRGIVTGFCPSQIDADPFFVITQNALANSLYLKYLRSCYQKKIYTPSEEDSQRCFNEYTEDAEKRLKQNQLKPGEDVRLKNGRIQVNGQVAVMSISALMAKIIFEKNPEREFFLEESYPLDWMYPHLAPAGPILKVHRRPLGEISEEMARQDREYWDRLTGPIIGKWLTDDTTVDAVCEFGRRVYRDKNLNNFAGDPAFAASLMAQKSFSKLRSAIGGVYAWRAQNTRSDRERSRMQKAADYALRQALGLCPASPEAVFRYVNLLLTTDRLDEAVTVAQTGYSMKQPEFQDQFLDLINRLREMQVQKTPKAAAEREAKIERLKKQLADDLTVSNAFQLAQLYINEKRTNDAVAVLRRALEDDHLDANGAVALAGAFVQLNQVPLLEETLRRLVKLAPENAEAHYDLAGVQALQGKADAALESLKTALQLNQQRRAKDPKAPNLKDMVNKDGRFKNLQKRPEFKQILGE